MAANYRNRRDSRENWAVVGHALVTLTEHVRKYADSEIQKYHKGVKMLKDLKGKTHFKDPSGNVHDFNTSSNTWNKAMGKSLGHPPGPAEQWPGDHPQGSSHHMFALTFLQSYCIKPTFTVDTADPSATLGLLENVPNCFPANVQDQAKKVRSTVRNEWGHANNMGHWNDAKFTNALDEIEELAVRAFTAEPALKTDFDTELTKLRNFKREFGEQKMVDILKMAEETARECMTSFHKDLMIEATEDMSAASKDLKTLVQEEIKQGFKRGFTEHGEEEAKKKKLCKDKEEQEDRKQSCNKCDKLCSSKLNPKNSARNLDSLLSELCGTIAAANTPDGKNFVDIKEEFISNNYPNFEQGLHVHPNIFISDNATHLFVDPDEDNYDMQQRKLYDFVEGQFKNTDCFIFQNFDGGIDKKVIAKFCDQLNSQLDSGTSSVEKLKEKLRTIATLACLNYDHIERDINTSCKEKEFSIVKCRKEIDIVKKHLLRKSYKKIFFVISLSLEAIIHFNMDSSDSDSSPGLKEYLEQLIVPDNHSDWKLLGFQVSFEEQASTQNMMCQCDKHKLNMKNEGHVFYQNMKKLLKEECGPVSSYKVKRRGHEKRKRQGYNVLISNLVVLSSMDLKPHSHAVGQVMKQLSRTSKLVVGPGDITSTDLYKDILVWNPTEKGVISNPPQKAVIEGDFGCGKSLLLHERIQTKSCSEDDGAENFLISFLQPNPERQFVRSILDVSNRLKYEEERVEVVSPVDIMRSSSELRRRRPNLPSSTDCLQFLYALTEQFRNCNISVDEVTLEDLAKRDQIHAKDFVGSLWLAVSSVSRYDFKDQRDESDIHDIPAANKQNFKIIHLKKNMRNGNRIVKQSFALQGDIIEKGTMASRPSADKNKDLQKNNYENKTNKTEKGTTTSRPSADENKDVQKNKYENKTIKTEAGEPSTNNELLEAIEDLEERTEQSEKEVEVRVVEGGKNAMFKTPKQEAKGCPNIPGKGVRLFKGMAAEGFMKEELIQLYGDQPIVCLGNEDSDVEWIVKHLDKLGHQYTVYNPKSEEETDLSEQRLENFLRLENSFLVAHAPLFNGMESAIILLAYTNPYASHFRANFLRASVEIIMLDWMDMETLSMSLDTFFTNFQVQDVISRRKREVIWKGELEWQEKPKDGPADQKITHSVACRVSTSKKAGVAEVKPHNWPPKLIMQLIPKTLVQAIGGEHFRDSKSVLFHPNACELLESLTKAMGSGFAGCVHFTGLCDIKVLILLYSNDKKTYLGFIPNDQTSFVDRIRTVIQRQKMGQQQPVRPPILQQVMMGHATTYWVKSCYCSYSDI